MSEGTPNVWIAYFDPMKNIEDAKRYGNLKEMFTGYVHYDIAVQQARKMFAGRYKEGDYILVVGDPKLVSIVVTVAEKYYSESGVINLLCWNKRKQEYFHEVFRFPDEDEELVEPPAEVTYKAARA